MAEREHFTNGNCYTGGGGIALVLSAFGAQIGGWHHWIAIGTAYGSGGVLAILSTVWITKSYYHRDREESTALTNTSKEADPLPKEERTHTLFNPLQLEAIELANDLKAFITSLDPMPKADKPHTFDGIWDNAVGPRWAWVCKMQTEYEDVYAPRVLAFTRTLGYAGRHNARLQNFISHIQDVESVNTIRAQLWKEALWELDIDFQGE